MSTQAPEQGLEKAAARTPEVITTSDEFRGAMARWQERGYHVLSPFTQFSGIAVSHGIIAMTVPLSPNKEDGDVYDGLPFLKDNEVAIAKNGLRKLAECMGINWKLERLDPRTIQFYWEVKAIVWYTGLDGAMVVREASKEWDLRDGSPQMKGWSSNQIAEARKHGLRNCEARAVNAAIRDCGCGIKQKYTRAELRVPFVALRVRFDPDMSDPDIKRMVTERKVAGAAVLYPHTAQLPAATAPIEDDSEPAARTRSVGKGSTSAASGNAAPPRASNGAANTATPDPDQPPTKDAVRIVDVKRTSGTRKDKSTWTRFAVVDSNGEECSTFDMTLGEAAEKYRDATPKPWVELGVEVQGQYRTLVEISPAGQSPKLPGMDDL